MYDMEHNSLKARICRGGAFPAYYNEKYGWVIAFNEREILYDDENFMVSFDTEEEAKEYIAKALEEEDA